MEVGGVSDLVDEHGAAVAAGLRPATDAGCEHEMVQHELTAAFEEVAQPRRALGACEHIVLLDPRHRLAAPLRRKFVRARVAAFSFARSRSWAACHWACETIFGNGVRSGCFMSTSALVVLVVAAPPDARLVAPLGCAVLCFVIALLSFNSLVSS